MQWRASAAESLQAGSRVHTNSLLTAMDTAVHHIVSGDEAAAEAGTTAVLDVLRDGSLSVLGLVRLSHISWSTYAARRRVIPAAHPLLNPSPFRLLY